MQTQFMLRPGEKVIREFSISPRAFWFSVTIAGLIIIIFPFVAQVFAGLLFSRQPTQSLLPLGFLFSTVVGAVIIAGSWYLRASHHYLLTSERVIETVGLISQRTVTAEYSQITDIRVTQDPFERFILNTGYVGINTAGGALEEIKLDRVANPYELCHQIRQLCEERLKQTGEYHQPPRVVQGPLDSSRPLMD